MRETRGMSDTEHEEDDTDKETREMKESWGKVNKVRR